MAKKKTVEDQIKQLKPKTLGIAGKPGRMVGQTEMCEILGITSKTLIDWVKQGCPFLPVPGHNGGVRSYDTAKVTEWYMKYQLQKIEASYIEVAPEFENQMQMFEAERRKKVAQALREELALAKEQSKVANIEDLMENFIEAANAIRATAMSFSNRLPGKLAHQSEGVIADILSEEVDVLLNHLVKYQHDYKERDE